MPPNPYLRSMIAAKLLAKEAEDLSDAELQRCLGNTGLRTKVIAEAKRMREDGVAVADLDGLANPPAPMPIVVDRMIAAETPPETIARLQKTIEDKDQAILVLNGLLDETDTELSTLKHSQASVEPSEPTHPLGDYRPAMPWTSHVPVDFDDAAAERPCIHCRGEGYGSLGGRCSQCNGRGWQ